MNDVAILDLLIIIQGIALFFLNEVFHLYTYNNRFYKGPPQ